MKIYLHKTIRPFEILFVLITIGFWGWISYNFISLFNEPSLSSNSGTERVFGASTIKASGNANLAIQFPNSFEETNTPNLSTDKNFWLNSGGRLVANQYGAGTIQGAISSPDIWYARYLQNNPVDTDNGSHPQNIFRLVSKNSYGDLTLSGYFKITADNLSASPNRNQSNGLFFMSRYIDGNNLYYTGLRVDGTAVVKKKINGIYYTLQQEKLAGLAGTYEHDSNPNLLPKNVLIGIKITIVNESKKSVRIKVYTDIGGTGTWNSVINTLDTGAKTGGDTLKTAGKIGIRTDFMDVQFHNLQLQY